IARRPIAAIANEPFLGPWSQRPRVAPRQRNGRLSLPAPERVQGQVVRDGEQPRRELGAGAVLLARAKDAQKDLLGQILSLFRIAHEVVKHADQTVLVLLHQFPKGLWLFVPDAQHQASIRVAESNLSARFADRCHADLVFPPSADTP